MTDFQGARFLVTGASGWIGQGLVSALLDQGALVAAHHRSPLPAHLQEHPNLVAVKAELTDVSAITSLVDRVSAELGPLDGLINNAAAQPVDAISTTSEARFDEVLDSGLKSVFFLIQQAAPAIRDGGAILNIASIEGLIAPPGHAHYGAAKAGVLALTRTAAVELAPRIRVNALLPGLISRPNIETQWPEGVARWQGKAPLQRLGTPQDLAAAALFLLSPAASWITGAALAVDGGMTARSSW